MPGGSPSVSAISNPTVTYANAGTYTVSLVASNTLGTGATVTQTISVSECTSINEHSVDLSDVTLLPNPANDELCVTVNNNNQLLYLKIRDITGKELFFQPTPEGNSFKVNLSEFTRAVYLIELGFKNKSTIYKKFVKE